MVYTVFTEWYTNEGVYEALDIGTYNSLEEAKKVWKSYREADTEGCTWIIVDEEQNIIV